MPENKPGRNDPCWCKSGKKYKNCHLIEDQRAASRKLVQDRLIQRLDEFAMASRFKSDFATAWEFFFQDKFQVTDDDQGRTDFHRAIDYFIHDYPLPDGHRIIDRFAAEEDKRLTAEERTVIEGWKHSRWTAFEVVAVEPGVGARLRDLASGEEFDVRDRRASEDLNRWEIVVVRMMPAGDHYELGDAPGLRFPPSYRGWLRSEIAGRWEDYQFGHPESTYVEFLHASSQLLYQFIEDEVMPALATPPIIATPERDLVQMCRSIFDVVDHAAALAALRRAEEFVDEGEKDGAITFGWHEVGASLDLLRAHGPAFEHKPPAGSETEPDAVRGLGNVSLTGTELVLETISRRRLEAGKDLLAQRLGTVIRHRSDEVKEVDHLPASTQEPDAKPEEDELPEEYKKMAAEIAAGYHRRWLDQEIPALAGRTPRQAAQNSLWRVPLVRLLKELEAGQGVRAHAGQNAFDMGELRRELGISDQEMLDESSLEDRMANALDEIYERADDGRVDEALEAWRAFRSNYPFKDMEELESATERDLSFTLEDTVDHLADRLARAKRYDQAIALLEEYLEFEPDDPAAVRAEIAEARAERGETDRALRDLRALITEEPDSFEAIETLATIQRELLDRLDDAIATLQRGIEDAEDDSRPDLVRELMGVYVEHGRLEEAERLWHETNDAEDDSNREYIGLAQIRLKQGDLEGARASAEKIQFESGRRFWLGRVEARRHDYDAARGFWAQTLEQPKRDDWGFWFASVESRLRLRDFDWVAENADPARFGADAKGYFLLALAQAERGDLDRAQDLARTARAEMERSSRPIERASIEREIRALADELEISPAARERLGL